MHGKTSTALIHMPQTLPHFIGYMKGTNPAFLNIPLSAMFLIIGAFENIALPYNLGLVVNNKILGIESGVTAYTGVDDQTQGEVITNFHFNMLLIPFFGLLIGGITSLIIPRKKGISLFNIFVLLVFGLSDTLHFSSIFISLKSSPVVAASGLAIVAGVVYLSKWSSIKHHNNQPIK